MVRIFDLQIGTLFDIFSPLLDPHNSCCRNNSQQAEHEHDKDKFVPEQLISFFFHVYHLGYIFTRDDKVIHKSKKFCDNSASLHICRTDRTKLTTEHVPQHIPALGTVVCSILQLRANAHH